MPSAACFVGGAPRSSVASRKYLTKGKQVYVSGKLQNALVGGTRRHVTRYTTERFASTKVCCCSSAGGTPGLGADDSHVSDETIGPR